jgi:hypothetical protein
VDLYNIWCDLKPGFRDVEFADAARDYLEHLRKQGHIEGFRITRAKLGFGVKALGEWHIMIELRDMVQLEQAFQNVACRRDPVEGLHFGVNHMVANPTFALYRDFPDAVRHRGQERF